MLFDRYDEWVRTRLLHCEQSETVPNLFGGNQLIKPIPSLFPKSHKYSRLHKCKVNEVIIASLHYEYVMVYIAQHVPITITVKMIDRIRHCLISQVYWYDWPPFV